MVSKVHIEMQPNQDDDDGGSDQQYWQVTSPPAKAGPSFTILLHGRFVGKRRRVF